MENPMRKPLIALLFLAACVPGAKDAPDAAQDYADYCAACHGATGKGDGIAAAGLSKKPADLTQLAARNGGEFPTTRVMAQIWGYAKAKGRGVMPDFAPMMTGDLVPYDGGDGIQTPTPERLVALAEYLKTLQK
jgi:mono/diheme cytochrome c family protein